MKKIITREREQAIDRKRRSKMYEIIFRDNFVTTIDDLNDIVKHIELDLDDVPDGEFIDLKIRRLLKK